jgi:hypothetical protein
VGHNYKGLLRFALDVGIPSITVFVKNQDTTIDERFPGVGIKEVAISEIQELEYWTAVS